MSRRWLRTLQLALCLAALILLARVYASSAFGERVARNNLWGMNVRHYYQLLARFPARQREAFLGNGSALSADQPQVSHRSGFYQRAFSLELISPNPAADVRFTTDGSIPTRRSPRFPERLTIDRTQTIRLKALQRGRLPSPATDLTFLLGEVPALPHMNLIIDPVHLFSRHSGIYIYRNFEQRGAAWERPVTVHLQQPGTLQGLNAQARLRIHGSTSRTNKRKSLRLYLSNEQGDLRSWFGEVAETISPRQDEWILRHAGNRNQIYRDQLGRRLAAQIGTITSPTLPFVLLVNGEPWGIYNLRERINEELCAGKVTGSSFTLTRELHKRPDMVIEGASSWGEIGFDVLASKLDLASLIDYIALEVFSANEDFTHGDINAFRSDSGGPWRFIHWDSDGGFNYMGVHTEHDSVAWFLRSSPRVDLKLFGNPDNEVKVTTTELFRVLMAEPSFRRDFLARFDELLGTVFSSENLHRTFDAVLASHAGTLDIELMRWEDQDADEARRSYEEQIHQIRDFLSRRPAVVQQLLLDHLGVEDDKRAGHPNGQVEVNASRMAANFRAR